MQTETEKRINQHLVTARKYTMKATFEIQTTGDLDRVESDLIESRDQLNQALREVRKNETERTD